MSTSSGKEIRKACRKVPGLVNIKGTRHDTQLHGFQKMHWFQTPGKNEKNTSLLWKHVPKKKRETLETFKMQIYSYIMLYNSSWMSPLRIILSDRRCYVEIFHDPFLSLKLWGETEFTSGKNEDSVWHTAWSIVDTIYIPLQHIFGNASQHTMEFICIPCGLLERISQKALGYFRPGLSMTSLQRQGCNSTTDMKKWLWMA